MRIQDMFFRNFWWKLASVVLATLIWFNYVYSKDGLLLSKSSGSRLELPVVPVTRSGDVRHFKTVPATVSVRLEGPANELKHVNPAELHAWVLVPDPAAANGTKLSVEISGLPPDVWVVTTVPDEVTLQAPGP